jgi:hypothetical protein
MCAVAVSGAPERHGAAAVWELACLEDRLRDLLLVLDLLQSPVVPREKLRHETSLRA